MSVKIYQNVWSTTKTLFTRKFIAVKLVNNKGLQRTKISDLSFYFKKLENKQQIKQC